MTNSTLMAWNNTQQFEAHHQRGSADGNALEAGSILEEVKGSAGLQSVPKKNAPGTGQWETVSKDSVTEEHWRGCGTDADIL